MPKRAASKPKKSSDPTRYDWHDEFGRALERLERLREKAASCDDLKIQLDCLKETSKLLSLYQPKDVVIDAASTENPDLEKIKKYLEPFGLGPPETPIVELVRRLTLLFTEKPDAETGLRNPQRKVSRARKK